VVDGRSNAAEAAEIHVGTRAGKNGRIKQLERLRDELDIALLAERMHRKGLL